MEETLSINMQLDQLRRLFEKHLGVRAPTFETAVRRAGRRVPRRLRAQVAVLLEAENFSAHPKLQRRIDRGAMDAAAAALTDYLTQQDIARDRTTQRLNTLAVLVCNMLVLSVLLLVVLRWRGFV